MLQQLYRHTPLQTTFGVNMLALTGGRPQMMGLRDVIVAFIEFREQVIRRRTVFLLGKARERAHVLAGLLVAINNLDPVIALIRAAPDVATARERLMAEHWAAEEVAPFIAVIDDPGHRVIDGRYQLSEAQARAILDLRLQRLTGMERDKLIAETQELAAEIERYLGLLGSRDELMAMLRGELIALKERFADPRRTTLESLEFEPDIEALIQREDMVVTVSHAGYIKRVPLSAYRAQRRGGKGRAGMATREEDFVTRVLVASTHQPVLFFTSRGMVHMLKVYRLPLGTPQQRGKAMVNLLPLEAGETISTVLPLPEDETAWQGRHVVFATARGNVRRNALSDFTSIRSTGKIAMKFEDDNAGDRLVGVLSCDEGEDMLLATRQGKCIRFPVGDVRVFSGRDSVGVRGIRLGEGDAVISLSILRHVECAIEERAAYLRMAAQRRRDATDAPPEGAAPDVAAVGETVAEIKISEERYEELAALEQFILSAASNGMGKRSSAYEYRLTGRGGQGIANMDLAERATVAATFPIGGSDQIMLMTDGGQLIRCPVDGIRIAGRRTQGVILLKVADGERVVSVTRLDDVADNGGEGGDEAGAADGDKNIAPDAAGATEGGET